jgi:hypothetical protein
MGCHNRVQQLDYVFTIAINASSSSHMALSPWRHQVIDYLRSLVTNP